MYGQEPIIVQRAKSNEQKKVRVVKTFGYFEEGFILGLWTRIELARSTMHAWVEDLKTKIEFDKSTP